jgi:5-oxoprolinase (ATP-hydrolysing) subunit A
MQKRIVDINVDVGEGIGNESLLMPHISSCNIACGGHAGDEDTMRAVVKLAKQHRVKIGAHPSFPDKENFGRTVKDMPSVALFAEIKNQIKGLAAILKEAHVLLHHVKPHGALYNIAAVDERVATVIVEVVKSLRMPVKLYVPYGSVIEKIAIQNEVAITYEGFADRNYNNDLTLVSRKEKDAIIHDINEVVEHVLRMITTEKVKTIDNKEVAIKADTFCVHGDHPNAINLIKKLRMRLEEKGIQVS